jgi:hypothetical protein
VLPIEPLSAFNRKIKFDKIRGLIACLNGCVFERSVTPVGAAVQATAIFSN